MTPKATTLEATAYPFRKDMEAIIHAKHESMYFLAIAAISQSGNQ
jgi:hypothetical protein